MFVDADKPRGTAASRAAAPAADATVAAPPDSTRRLRSLDAAVLERKIGELAGQIAAATCRWLMLVAEFDRRGEHERQGFACCGRWLAWRCSVSRRTAFEYVRVARALRELPLITAAFAAGRLSYSKVRALTRVADPDDEPALLEMAEEATAGQLERILVGYRKAISPSEAEEARARRHLSTSWEPDGTLRISGNLPAEEGAVLLKALDVARDALRGERIADRCRMPTAADALVALADESLATGGRGSGRSGGDRYQVVCHVDLADLEDPAVARRNGVVADRAALSPATVARLACDASIVTIVESGGEPVSVGRKTRAIPAAIARALRSRDRGCRFPGCDSTRFVDAHHVKHWAAGGETALGNLVQLCRRHHRLVHEGGFGVEMSVGQPTFKRPDGTTIPNAPPLRAPLDDRGQRSAPMRRACEIGPWTVAARSRGAPFDLDLTVWTLACRRE